MDSIHHKYADNGVVIATSCSEAELDLLDFSDLEPDSLPYAAEILEDDVEVFYDPGTTFGRDEIRESVAEMLESEGDSVDQIRLTPDVDRLEQIYNNVYGDVIEVGGAYTTEVNPSPAQGPESTRM